MKTNDELLTELDGFKERVPPGAFTVTAVTLGGKTVVISTDSPTPSFLDDTADYLVALSTVRWFGVYSYGYAIGQAGSTEVVTLGEHEDAIAGFEVIAAGLA